MSRLDLIASLLASLLLQASIAAEVQSKSEALRVRSKPPPEDSRPWVQQVGLRPRVFYFHNFLTEEERTHMIRLAAPQMKRSLVSGKDGDGVVDNIRTSYGMFIRRLQDPIIERIERRISTATQIPVSHQEDIQVLRYTKGQKYGAHYDSAYDNEESGPHQRLATFYMYLSDVEEGGETAFPENSVWYDPAVGKAADPTFSNCAKGHVAAKPKAGDAALFYSFFPNKTMDPASMHTGCPVVKGIKWGAPVWIHIDMYEPADWERIQTQRPQAPPEPGLCLDSDDRCKGWAAQGECKHNPKFMIGDGGETGVCRQSCKACETCDESNEACIARNRKAGGYLQLDRDEMEWLGVQWWLGDQQTPAANYVRTAQATAGEEESRSGDI